MMRIISILAMVSLVVFLFVSCEKEKTGEGTVKLSITDAPVDTDGISEVNITVKEVHYGKSDSDWETFVLEAPQTYNLLDLQRGNSEMMGLFELSAGTYTQIRFILDASEAGNETESKPGCYLVMEDGTQKNLFVPSGVQTGYKAVGSFDVPVNGEVDITADFDARKSVVKAGASGKYLLKPTIRLIVNNQAGHIAGKVSNIQADKGITIYAYEDGTYKEFEADDPGEEKVRFPNAVTSDVVDEGNEFYLAYLAEETYDLVVVSTIEGGFSEVLGIVEDVNVTSNATEDIEIDVNSFSSSE